MTHHSDVHVFTSITANYLPKARVLAHSVKRLAPDVRFHLMLSDELPDGFTLDAEPFDTIIRLEDLGISNLHQWVFGHTVVELCTAVKGFAFQHVFDMCGAELVFYFDPDIAVFSRLDELVERLRKTSILLTPHQSIPEATLDAIADNEIASLKHGVFNLGFVGVRATTEGRRFVDWWSERLRHFCHDDPANGLFTDQRWVNLAPCFFSDIEIARDSGFNVATWNLSRRPATGSLDAGIYMNGEPLGFYHFSGMDSGAQEVMLNKYGAHSPALLELRRWYLAECERMGQSQLGKLPARHACFDDGTPIEKAQRVLYRTREDLRRAFPDPFLTQTDGGGYLTWYRQNYENEQESVIFVARSDMRFRDALVSFVAFTESRLRRTQRISGWRKKLAGAVLGLSRKIVARLR